MTIIETLVQNHPVRKTKAQKAAFREWFAQEAAGMGYTADVHTKGSSSNIVIGRPEAAAVTYTAHYDTPPVMPIPNVITPRNVLVYILYQLLIVVGFFAVAFGVSFVFTRLTGMPELGGTVGFVAVYALLGLMLFGPANKNCVNDNTSGVAAVMEIMTRLPEDQRSKAAFILFDNEEKGLLGSSAYAAEHKQVKKNGLIINLDCVGDGGHKFFFANKKTRALPQYALLCDTLGAQEGCTLHMEPMEKAVYPSDQAQFVRLQPDEGDRLLCGQDPHPQGYRVRAGQHGFSGRGPDPLCLRAGSPCCRCRACKGRRSRRRKEKAVAGRAGGPAGSHPWHGAADGLYQEQGRNAHDHAGGRFDPVRLRHCGLYQPGVQEG